MVSDAGEGEGRSVDVQEHLGGRPWHFNGPPYVCEEVSFGRVERQALSQRIKVRGPLRRSATRDVCGRLVPGKADEPVNAGGAAEFEQDIIGVIEEREAVVAPHASDILSAREDAGGGRHRRREEECRAVRKNTRHVDAVGGVAGASCEGEPCDGPISGLQGASASL